MFTEGSLDKAFFLYIGTRPLTADFVKQVCLETEYTKTLFLLIIE